MLHVTDLPIGFLVDVASYLPTPSRALFAVAMSAPSASWQNDKVHRRLSAITKAIVSSTQWQELDFEDIERDLSKKLSDDDIGAVLQCINAKQTVKRLKLAGCVNITGRGLDTLRGLTVLEQIDLSLVGKHVNVHIIKNHNHC